MPRGRRANPDKRVSDLIAQLKVALVAREQQRIESQVASRVDALVRGLQGSAGGSRPPAVKTRSTVSAPAAPKRGNRKPRSAASREAQRKRMLAYWAAKRAGKKTAGKKG